MGGRQTAEGSIYYPIESLGDDAGLVQTFQDDVEQIRKVHPSVLEMDSVIASADEVAQKSTTQTCVDYVESKIDTDWSKRWYVDSEDTAEAMYGLRRVMISRTSVAETSAHRVFFGKLSGAHHSVRVAIKPFVDNPDKVVAEWVNMEIAQRRGLDVFRPLGFMLDKNGGPSFMVTERTDGVEAMDNTNWGVVLSQPERHAVQLEDLMKIGPTLAGVHHKGCYHGDTQFKNLVITQSGSVHLIDWEAALFVSPDMRQFTDQDSELPLRSKAVHDLKVLFGSMARSVDDFGVGLLTGLTPQAQYSYFKELIMDPYIKKRLALAEAHGSEDEALAVMEHLSEVEAEVTAYIVGNGLARSLAQVRQGRARSQPQAPEVPVQDDSRLTQV